MKFERNKKVMHEEDLAWLDCRMIAFKHNLMDSRLLYWDAVSSRTMQAKERYDLSIFLSEYLAELDNEYPDDIMNFSILESMRKYNDFYRHQYYLILGDGVVIGLTPEAEPEKIVRDLNYAHDGRSAIGYYTGYNNLVLPDGEMHLLDFPYFKAQMKIDGLVDSKPTEEQIEEYYQKNYDKVMRMELVNKNNLSNMNGK